MGYMGFGMRKEVYTRKPRKPFKKLKKLLDIELKKGHKKGIQKSDFTKEEIAIAKAKIREKLKAKKEKELLITIFAICVIILSFLLLS